MLTRCVYTASATSQIIKYLAWPCSPKQLPRNRQKPATDRIKLLLFQPLNLFKMVAIPACVISRCIAGPKESGLRTTSRSPSLVRLCPAPVIEQPECFHLIPFTIIQNIKILPATEQASTIHTARADPNWLSRWRKGWLFINTTGLPSLAMVGGMFVVWPQQVLKWIVMRST